MTTPHDSPLGRETRYAQRHDPALLFPIARAAGRDALGLGTALPFHGVDLWNAYELSWLDARGKPQIALARFAVPASSPNLIESKSFKLYLGSFSGTRMAGTDAVRACLVSDLSRAAGAPVEVALTPPADFAAERIETLDGECIDDLDLAISDYGPPRLEYLSAEVTERIEEVLVSHLLKSNCPVTGQPDWASVQIAYAGPRIAREGLLRYLVSFRDHSDFHEQCVERIFCDIRARCACERFAVYARYTRRGGLDINPWRSTSAGVPPNPRLARQ